MAPQKITPKLWSWASDLEASTRQQAERTSRLPIVAGHVALMPDAHLGLGATVGSVGNAGIPEIVQAHGLSGPSDLLLRVVCVDAEDLFRVTGAIQATDGVERAETALDMGELIPYRIHPLLARDAAP